MFVGRIVEVGRNRAGDLVAACRVSSWSFHNGHGEQLNDTKRFVARQGSADPASDSRYIANECPIRKFRFAVVGDGHSHQADLRATKPWHAPRDAVVSVLAGLHREFDQHDTPQTVARLIWPKKGFGSAA